MEMLGAFLLGAGVGLAAWWVGLLLRARKATKQLRHVFETMTTEIQGTLRLAIDPSLLSNRSLVRGTQNDLKIIRKRVEELRTVISKIYDMGGVWHQGEVIGWDLEDAISQLDQILHQFNVVDDAFHDLLTEFDAACKPGENHG